MVRTLTNPLQKKLGEALREHRKAAGLSQIEVAEKLGRYQSYVNEAETGGRRIDVGVSEAEGGAERATPPPSGSSRWSAARSASSTITRPRASTPATTCARSTPAL